MILRRLIARAPWLREATTPRRNHRGVVILLVTIAMLALLTFVATAVDIGAARAERTNTQSAADLSVLAALNVLARGGTMDDASLAARRIVEQNLGVDVNSPLWTGCQDAKSLENAGGQLAPTDLAIGNHCISFKAGSPAIGRVRIPTRQVNTVFGKIVGIATIDVTASAGADGDPNRCELLDPTCVEIATTSTTTTTWSWSGYCNTLGLPELYLWNWDDSQCRGQVPGTDDTTRSTFLSSWCGARILEGNTHYIYLYYWTQCSPFVGLSGTDRNNWLTAECRADQVSWIANDWWFQVACRSVVGNSTVDAWLAGYWSTTTTSPPTTSGPSTTTAPTTTVYDPLRLNY